MADLGAQDTMVRVGKPREASVGTKDGSTRILHAKIFARHTIRPSSNSAMRHRGTQRPLCKKGYVERIFYSPRDKKGSSRVLRSKKTVTMFVWVCWKKAFERRQYASHVHTTYPAYGTPGAHPSAHKKCLFYLTT